MELPKGTTPAATQEAPQAATQVLPPNVLRPRASKPINDRIAETRGLDPSIGGKTRIYAPMRSARGCMKFERNHSSTQAPEMPG